MLPQPKLNQTAPKSQQKSQKVKLQQWVLVVALQGPGCFFGALGQPLGQLDGILGHRLRVSEVSSLWPKIPRKH